ncbi:hypothetical protein BGZ94_008974 [Podila epigama]|nr:hypothetical protein BGZ94_008974 [Podila epigama]
MSYNPVSTDSRSNSPDPLSYQQHLRTTPGLSQSPLAPEQESLRPLHQNLSQQRTPFLKDTNSLGRQHQRQSYISNNSNTMDPSYNQYQYPVAPFASGSAASSSIASSFDARAGVGGSTVSSTHRSQRSSNNLSPANDPNYNITQTDITLEGLAERWTAYQAWWAKQYKEQPFYRLWTKSKWILFFSVLLLLAYSAAALAIAIGYMIGHFEHSAVAMEIHGNLVYITLAASIMGLITGLIGMIGVIRENRVWLSWFNVLLWPLFCLYLSVGYITFRRVKYNLRAHLREEWLHSYTRSQRLVIQRTLKCCGYDTPSVSGAYDMRCFPMTVLPGCRTKYNNYEKDLLTTCWTVSFALVPVQLFVMIAALLCSNHVDGMLRSARPGLKSFKEK